MSDKVCIVGLGYVGLPLAVEFAKKYEVIGFDISSSRVAELQKGEDHTGECDSESLKQCSAEFTADPKRIAEAKFVIVAVPTPVNNAKQPDFAPLLGASKTVGANLSKGSIVVFESTVYPGATEEVCLPVLEKESGLSCPKDFQIGYSPERINPGDKVNTISKIVKIVSGCDGPTLASISKLYGDIITAGICEATSIKVAEAAKIVENTQRDINIALMNELAMIFDQMDIRTSDVLEAAGTKWNFLRFHPGLVGGHCIGVDPYYLTHKSEILGYKPDIILASRKINNGLGHYIANKSAKLISQSGRSVSDARVLIAGFSFKENVKDVRNTRVIDIYETLREWGVQSTIFDPVCDLEDVKSEYNINVSTEVPSESSYDAIVYAVPHTYFREYKATDWTKYLKDQKGVFIDIRSLLDPKDFSDSVSYWSL